MNLLSEMIEASMINLDSNFAVIGKGKDELSNLLELARDKINFNDWRWKPVNVEEWILGEKYLNLKSTIRRVLLEDIKEFFGRPHEYQWDRKYDEYILCSGIGAGKSFITSVIITYFQHLLLCLRNPQQFFGIADSSKIAILNMSISAQNAKKVIFSEVLHKIYNCLWFQEYGWGDHDARMPDPDCLSELRFKNNTFIIPGASNWQTTVGYNVLVGVIDEAGAMRSRDNKDQAEDIYNSLKRRVGSRFESKGAIVVVGSSLYENDFLEKKISNNLHNPRVLSKRRALWEVKYSDWTGDVFWVDRINKIIYDKMPNVMNAEIDVIPKIDFIYEAFQSNPTKAYRDYGALPSPTINPFFEQAKIVLDKINRERTNDPIDRNGQFAAWFVPLKGVQYYIHIDLAVSGDAAGFCMGHASGKTDKGELKGYIDLMMRFKGSKENPIEFAKIREVIYLLKKLGFNIALVTFDSYQSVDSIQILRSKGFKAETLSIDRTTIPYNNLKSLIREGRLDYYYIKSGNVWQPSPSEVCIRELMQLEDIQGKKIDHPPSGSKDMSDSMAGVVQNLIDNQNIFGKVKAKVG
jgi:hypothetical protein